MYKFGRLTLDVISTEPAINTLAMDNMNKMFYHDNTQPKRLLGALSIVPKVVDDKKSEDVLIQPNRFSPKHLYAIMNGKMQSGDKVMYLSDERGDPKYTAAGFVTIILYVDTKVSRKTLLDALEAIAIFARKFPSEDIDVARYLQTILQLF